MPVETAREHLTQVQSSVAAVKKEIKKIDSETATKAGIQEDVAAIMKQLDECEKMCGMAEKAIAGGKVENAPVCAHCASIEKQLLAIRKSEDAMLKKLGIDIPMNTQSIRITSRTLKSEFLNSTESKPIGRQPPPRFGERLMAFRRFLFGND